MESGVPDVVVVGVGADGASLGAVIEPLPRPSSKSRKASSNVVAYHFRLKHANIVAYLTTPTTFAPRTTAFELREFLSSLIEGDLHRPFISTDNSWISKIQRVAHRALSSSRSIGIHNSVLPDRTVKRTLGDLKKILGD